MFAKLFAVALIAIAFVAVSEAAVATITYSDSSCGAAIGYYASNQACNPVTKRSTEEVAGTNVCSPLSVDGPWYKVLECTNSVGDPTTAIPSGFQSFKGSSAQDCDFANNLYDVAGTLSGLTPVVGYGSGLFISLNVTISCINGDMAFQSCVPGLGCTTFSSILPNVCTNATSTVMNLFYNGIQTSCVPTPQAPMAAPMTAPMAAPMAAPMTAPMAAPVAAPKAATPVRRSDAVSVAVGSVVALAAAATLLW